MATSLTPIGNDQEGAVVASLEGRLLGLDAAGNVVLNTSGNVAGKPARGVPGVVGLGIPYNAAISNAKGAANVSNVSFQVQDCYGNPIAGIFEFDVYLSDSSVGAGLTATTASGGVAAAAGAILGALTTSKAVRAQTNAAGLFTLAITDTAKTGFFPCAYVLPGFPAQVGAQLTSSGSYT